MQKSNLYKLAILSFLGIIVLGYYLSQTVIPSIASQNEEIQQKKLTLSQERARLSRLASLSQQEELLNKYVTVIQRALPKDDEKTSIPLLLDSIASKHNVSVARVTGSTVKNKTTTPDWITIEVRATGPYQNVLDFIQSLENSNRMTDLETLTMTGVGKGQVEASIRVKAYFKL